MWAISRNIFILLSVTLLSGCAGSHIAAPPAAQLHGAEPVGGSQNISGVAAEIDPDADIPPPAEGPGEAQMKEMPAPTGPKDPYEAMNRHFFKMNMRMNRHVLAPVVQGYVDTVPAPVRRGVHNLLKLANMPVVFANDLLQARFEAAGQTLTRTTVNVVFGLGVFDAASSFGIGSHGNDFGRTLGVWGWKDPPYLMLPLLGPTSPRDAIGFAGNIALDPAIVFQYPYFVWVLAGRKGAELIDRHARLTPVLKHINRQALDPYSTMRSLYLQHRKQQIHDAANKTDP